MSRPYAFVAVATFLLLCPLALAQGDSATISGEISGPGGAVLVGAQVRVTNLDTGARSATLTNASGVYVFPNLRPGLYRLVADKAGFRQIVLAGLTLNVQDAIDRNFIMEVGSVVQSVTVTAGGQEVNVSPAVSTVVNDQFVQNMPLNGRSFQSLIYLTPGVALTTSYQDAPGQFSVNGQRNNANYFMIDGVSATFGTTPSSSLGQTLAGTTPTLTAGGGTNGLVSVDAMQEFRIQTSSTAPEFGRMPGAQISIVTKGGGNYLHGTAYDYLRNDFFDARNYFDHAQPQNGNPALPKPELRQNDFGGTVGGPIVQDRTFFFFSYEGLRLRLPDIDDGYFLTAASRANVSAVWAPIIAAIPVPDANAKLVDPSCNNVTIPCNGEIRAVYSDPSSNDTYSLRIDHTLIRKINLFGRYNHAPSALGENNFSQVQQTIFDNDTATVGMTMALSPTMVNESRANWSRAIGFLRFTLDTFHGAIVPSQSVLYPAGFDLGNAQAYFGITADGGGGLVQTGTLDNNTQRQLNFIETLSKTVGAHQLKFGADFRRMKPTTSTDNGDAVFVYGWPALQTGTVNSLLTGASTPITAHTYNLSFFGQDTWKVTPRLTLTYGLRWDINTPPVSDTAVCPLYAVQGIFDSKPFQLAPAGTPLWHTQHDAFAPRMGAAYQITPRMLVRGGFGLFYDLGYGGDAAFTLGGTFPYLRQNFVNGDDPKGNPVLPLNLSLPIYQPLPFSTTITKNALYVSAVDPRLRLPVTYQWNVAFQRELSTNQSITATFVGANGQRLLLKEDIVPPGSVFNGGTGLVLATMGNGYSRYNALQVQFMRRMSHGLQALVSYTLAKSSDVGSLDVTEGNGYSFASVSSIVLPALAPSDFDIRNSISAALSYQIPGPAWGKVGRAALGKWAVAGIFRASTGPPINVLIGGVDPGIGAYKVQPNVVPGQPIWIPMPSEPAGKSLNPFAFTLPSFPEQGNSERNGIRSPYGINQTDLALRRRFNLTERVTLDARLEYFNLFNHPMFGGQGFAPNSFWGFCSGNTAASCPKPTISPNGFGTVATGLTLNVGLGGGGLNGGQSPLYAPGGPRSAQLALKLSF
jgi:outer membrane receptor protein involved in Fe transport